MCIWKSLKNVRTGVTNLKKYAALDWFAYQWKTHLIAIGELQTAVC